ncbi:AAAP amino acid permease [Syncephalis fuscata]|nr:AAAP amino acid permease [Syncephalis fuscata]
MTRYKTVASRSRTNSIVGDDNEAINVDVPLTTLNGIETNRHQSYSRQLSAENSRVGSPRHRYYLRSNSEASSNEDEIVKTELHRANHLLNNTAAEDDANGDHRGLLTGSIKYNSNHGVETQVKLSDEDYDDLVMGRNQTASIMESFLNMANSIVGAGLPYSFREAGFWSGILLLIVLTYIVDWTVGLLIKNSRMSSKQSYQDLMEFCYGRPGLWAISIFQFIFAFGGDTIPSVLSAMFPSMSEHPVFAFLASRRTVIFLCTVGITFPLSLYRDIAKLAKASAFALVALVIIIVAVMIEAPRTPTKTRGDPSLRWTFINPEIFQSIGVICFAFVCHHNTFVILNALKRPSLNRFSVVTHLSMVVSLITCLIMAISGYLAFTDKTEGNVLNNFSNDNVIINIARLCFGMNMFSTLPLEHFVVREVIETLFLKGPISTLTNFLLTTVLIGAALVIALTTCDLGFVMELTGGISATALAFILPPACYIKLASGPLWSRKKLPSLICIGFGVIVMCLSTSLSIRNYIIDTSKRSVCQW